MQSQQSARREVALERAAEAAFDVWCDEFESACPGRDIECGSVEDGTCAVRAEARGAPGTALRATYLRYAALDAALGAGDDGAAGGAWLPRDPALEAAIDAAPNVIRFPRLPCKRGVVYRPAQPG